MDISKLDFEVLIFPMITEPARPALVREITSSFVITSSCAVTALMAPNASTKATANAKTLLFIVFLLDQNRPKFNLGKSESLRFANKRLASSNAQIRAVNSNF